MSYRITDPSDLREFCKDYLTPKHFGLDRAFHIRTAREELYQRLESANRGNRRLSNTGPLGYDGLVECIAIIDEAWDKVKP